MHWCEKDEERQPSRCAMLSSPIMSMTALMLMFVIVLMLVMLHADRLEWARDRVNGGERVCSWWCPRHVRVHRVSHAHVRDVFVNVFMNAGLLMDETEYRAKYHVNYNTLTTPTLDLFIRTRETNWYVRIHVYRLFHMWFQDMCTYIL